MATAAPATRLQERPQAQQPAADELSQLAAQLAQPGPDGREARERAIERLLAMPRPEAHAILHARLAVADDPDGVRLTILASLQRHVVLAPEQQFGGARAAARTRLLADWLRALAPCWRDLRRNVEDLAGDPVRDGARTALQRVPARDLDAASRLVFAQAPADEQIVVMRCLADMQHTLFATTLADQLEATDPALRAAAQDALQLLTCSEEPIRTRGQFAAWSAANGALRYVDLVERAARRGSVPNERMAQELARLRIDAARDVVRAHVMRAPGIDWAAVQARVVVDDPLVIDACLELLQQALPMAVEDASPARQVFCRALVQRHRDEPVEQARRRAALLEVAAYLGRAEDVDLATELRTLLHAQLDAGDTAARVAALRGLRRYPSSDSRAKLVALGRRLLVDPAAPPELLPELLATLTSRSTPRWTAPSPTAPDKADWLAFVAAACRSDEARGLRERALELAHVLDAREQRVPEVFDLVLALVRDESLGKFRSTCAIHLQGWRNEPTQAEAWVRAQQELLADPVPDLRRQAAEALASLTDSVHPRRSDWISSTILAVRERLATEPDAAVFRTFVECVQVCGRQPQMPEKAMGALRFALGELGEPVPAEQQFRVDPLLQALATVGADPRADRGQWLNACEPLLQHRRRQSLRLILQTHAAVELAKDVASTDPSAAQLARQAMKLLIETALLKPAREPWSASEELGREARDVRIAFGALDPLDETQRLDQASHRLLRLEVDLVAGKPQEVAQRGAAWLANGNGGRSTMTAAERGRMQQLTAEANLALGKPADARRLVEDRAEDAPTDASTLDLEARIARALVATDLAGAVAMLDRVVLGTPPEDPSFRARLVEWMQLRVRLDPALRQDNLRVGRTHEALFRAADCPAELREAFDQLLASR